MLPEIGIIVAVYVLFRGFETCLKTARGGPYADLHVGAQLGIVLAAMGAMLVAGYVGYDLLRQGTKAAADLPSGLMP